MTFSIVARDNTGAFGSAVCSSSPAVAARCMHLRDGVGVVNSQNVTDPRLGAVLLDQLSVGKTATEAVADVAVSTQHVEYRQLLVLGADQPGAIFSGTEALGVVGEAAGANSLAAGNLLADANVPQVMVEAFETATGDLESRLMAAMQAAKAAGGEAGPVHSIGMAVVREAGWRVTDLRIDWTEDDPIQGLQDLLEIWLPQRDDYVIRGLNPTFAPSYGVPGDE
ncbi:DUF1028 domain-containing protein [Enteractinococcus helveticum]|uniref:Fimbrial assembly protein FimA n=1 Tax=Enteractinococcus helveticum TaxID=1837282 RepID=A0A1B7M229_9MICC|nr:DUF1028 domain-containing protein [Enteractinococcus helveticum]OAV62599.1 fimbrial assembly protein FimA [Enteractinococcus helveticum]